MELLDRLQNAFPSESLREVFTEIIGSINLSFEMEQEYLQVEANLLEKEG